VDELVEALRDVAPTTPLDRLGNAANRLVAFIDSRILEVVGTPTETGQDAPPVDPSDTPGEGDGTNPDGSVTGLA